MATIQNPIVDGWYADPEARKYGDKYYIYVTGSAKPNNLDAFSSSDLMHWEKHEGILAIEEFPYVHKCVWAPTVIEKNEKYYLIFASNDIHSDEEPGGLELAVSDRPEGPFHACLPSSLVGEFHNGAQPIDAHLFKDEDGTVYLYYGGWRHCNVCRMAEDLSGLAPLFDGSREYFREITPPDYVEGPCMMKRGAKYHFMWSAGGWTNGTYRVNTCTSDKPWGPFTEAKTILSTGDSTIANGPGHNGYLYLAEQDRYLIVYHRHHNDIRDGNARFMCIDDMPLDENGDILPIKMTKEWKLQF